MRRISRINRRASERRQAMYARLRAGECWGPDSEWHTREEFEGWVLEQEDILQNMGRFSFPPEGRYDHPHLGRRGGNGPPTQRPPGCWDGDSGSDEECPRYYVGVVTPPSATQQLPPTESESGSQAIAGPPGPGGGVNQPNESGGAAAAGASTREPRDTSQMDGGNATGGPAVSIHSALVRHGAGQASVLLTNNPPAGARRGAA